MSRPKKTTPQVRLNLSLPPQTRAQIEQLQEETAADSLAEVVRQALQVYDVVVATQNGQGQLVIRVPETDNEHILRIL